MVPLIIIILIKFAVRGIRARYSAYTSEKDPLAGLGSMLHHQRGEEIAAVCLSIAKFSFEIVVVKCLQGLLCVYEQGAYRLLVERDQVRFLSCHRKRNKVQCS